VTYLEITTKDGLGRRTVELRDEPLRVGRARTNDIVLRDTRISRHHCVIEVVAGRPIIRDLGSVRGIKVNNRRREESDLRQGDRVRIGPFTIALRAETAEEKQARRQLNGVDDALDHWDASEQSDSDETATPEIGGNESAAVDHHTRRRLEELASQVSNLERDAHKRERTLESLLEDVQALRDEQRNAPFADIIEPDQASSEALGAHLQEFSLRIEERAARFDELNERLARLDGVADRVEQLEASVAGTTNLGTRADSAEQRAAETADRLDQLARNHEQVAFEHAQVAGAVHELAARLASMEESLQPLASLAGRLSVLDEITQQNSMNAQHALEQATQLAARLQGAQQAAQSMDNRITDLAQMHAESAATFDAHEVAMQQGSQQIERIASLVEEISAQQRAGARERAELNAGVQCMQEELSQVREWFDELEKRLAGSAEPKNDNADAAAHAAQLEEWNMEREAHQREMAALRNSVEAVGARLSARLARLEGASADAAPELSALKEQVRRLSDSHPRETTSPRLPVKAMRSAPPPSSTAVLERPAPVPIPRTPSVGPSSVPSSVDNEQTRQVMSRIFQGKEVQDDRYRPARDLSAIFFLVLVAIVAVGVAVILLAPKLLSTGV
jgi:hypothetical protein